MSFAFIILATSKFYKQKKKKKMMGKHSGYSLTFLFSIRLVRERNAVGSICHSTHIQQQHDSFFERRWGGGFLSQCEGCLSSLKACHRRCDECTRTEQKRRAGGGRGREVHPGLECHLTSFFFLFSFFFKDGPVRLQGRQGCSFHRNLLHCFLQKWRNREAGDGG